MTELFGSPLHIRERTAPDAGAMFFPAMDAVTAKSLCARPCRNHACSISPAKRTQNHKPYEIKINRKKQNGGIVTVANVPEQSGFFSFFLQ